MKKLVILFIFLTTGASAQSINAAYSAPGVPKLRLFEFEFGFGMNIPKRWEGYESCSGTNFLVELRLNRPVPVDFGVQLKGAGFTHRIPDLAKVKSTLFTPSFFVDYNWRQPDGVSFFAGLGAGRTFVDHNAVAYAGNYVFLFAGKDNSFALTPRAGIVIFENIRVTAEYAFADERYSCFGINVGGVLSGIYKKPRKIKRSPYGI